MKKLDINNGFLVNIRILENFTDKEILENEDIICKLIQKSNCRYIDYVSNPTEKMYLAWCKYMTGHAISILPDYLKTEEHLKKLIPCGPAIYKTLLINKINPSIEWIEAFVCKYPAYMNQVLLHLQDKCTEQMWLHAKKSLKNTNILPKQYIDDELFDRAVSNGRIKYAYDLIIQGYDNYEKIYQVLEDYETYLYDKVKNRYVPELNDVLYKMPCLEGHENMYKKIQCIKDSD